MAGFFRKEPSQRSKRDGETPTEQHAHHSVDQKEFNLEDFDKRVVIYENQVDVENLESHFYGFQGMV